MEPPPCFYTSVTEPDLDIGTVRSATPNDDSWDSWTKGGKLTTAPDLGEVAYRDPFVFRDGGQWRMFVGAGLEGRTAAAVSYSSPDLSQWTLDGIAAQRSGTETDPVWTGTMWECPQLFDIGSSHVLVTSIWEDDVLHYVAYGVQGRCRRIRSVPSAGKTLCPRWDSNRVPALRRSNGQDMPGGRVDG
ncbi:glycoside hydrolase family 32 protein [Arthrobacter sp. PsM3]|uniref:glycoside hydrolase family 32 protein n=1 Tax=Arthrobacter sp. PsM3 TaxID=3030531 RepID=UPI00263B1DCA|nr:glycoside hydrolase family 32 protein [Arthrobacter sp. PsM3]MDN4645993.1 glycoside hydrolase family 32 protein [Arthrobacter sp. PsM3]